MAQDGLAPSWAAETRRKGTVMRMATTRAFLMLVVLAAVLLCAPMAQASPAAKSRTGTVTLEVAEFICIWIPPGTEPVPGYPELPYRYPLKQSNGTIGVTADLIGTTATLSTRLRIYATATCGTWVRVPDTLLLQDHGTYETTAQVFEEPGDRTITPDHKAHQGGYYYDRFGQGIPAGTEILNAVVSRQQLWTQEDVGGIYWGTLFVDIMASDVTWGTTSNPTPFLDLPWPTHTEPNIPPHTF